MSDRITLREIYRLIAPLPWRARGPIALVLLLCWVLQFFQGEASDAQPGA
jgi:hypothetical protein